MAATRGHPGLGGGTGDRRASHASSPAIDRSPPESVVTRARSFEVESTSRSGSLVEHDLFGKPVSTHRVKPEGMLSGSCSSSILDRGTEPVDSCPRYANTFHVGIICDRRKSW
jgi:hypothetical protein